MDDPFIRFDCPIHTYSPRALEVPSQCGDERLRDELGLRTHSLGTSQLFRPSSSMPIQVIKATTSDEHYQRQKPKASPSTQKKKKKKNTRYKYETLTNHTKYIPKKKRYNQCAAAHSPAVLVRLKYISILEISKTLWVAGGPFVHNLPPLLQLFHNQGPGFQATFFVCSI